MAHKHSVYDTDPHFTINPITRLIKNESSGKVILIQGDHNSERFTFELPRMIEEHDMLQCDKVKVHFINTGKTGTTADAYDVLDFQASPEDENIVIFSWLISGAATRHVGPMQFAVEFQCTTEGVVEYAWHTAVFTGISISTGINNSEQIVEQYSDILEEWRAKLFEMAQTDPEEITEAVNNYLERNPVKGTEINDEIASDETTYSSEKIEKELSGLDTGITRVESLDTETPGGLVNLRDLETGLYVLYGYFSPYANSDMSMIFDNTMVVVSRKTAGSHLLVFTGLNSKVNFLEILVDESQPGGHTYTRTDFVMLDMHNLIKKVGELESLTTEDKSSIVAAINEIIERESQFKDQYALKTDLPTKASDVGALPSDGTAADSANLGGKDAKYYNQPRNLLDNSWWKVQKEIVNQRGQTEYTSNGYTIDRWEIYDGAVGVTSLGYITTSGQMYQKIDIPTDKVYTFAIENDTGIAVVTGIPANGIHSATLGNALIKLATIDEYVEVVIEPSEGYDIAGAYWAALYEGEYTADNLPPYVPKGYAAELAECQRYYWQTVIADPILRFTNRMTQNVNAWDTVGNIWFPARMRITPSVTMAYDISDDVEIIAYPYIVSDCGCTMPIVDLAINEKFDLHWVKASADL